MKHIRTTISIFLLLIFSINIQAENPCGIMVPRKDTSNWGIGYIGFPKNTTLKGTTIETKTTCYIGKGIIRFNNDSTIKLDWKDFSRIGSYSGIITLKVFKISDTKYKVCSNTLKESIWIELNDMKSKGLHFSTYLALMSPRIKHINDNFNINAQNTNMGINLLNSCLNLRTKPSLNGDIVTCLKSNSWEGDSNTHIHIEIIDFSGEWAYVIAREYMYDEKADESGEGCSFKVIFEHRGYVKAIDNNGRPNIWYSGY